ncbi:hypothetical protein imdm_484 [gamma proteobacterium IMCC2047]|nr:hypothetical protein imdm_484 [gamma proteobacterium IMCC2047]
MELREVCQPPGKAPDGYSQLEESGKATVSGYKAGCVAP